MEPKLTDREVWAIENIMSAEHCSNNFCLPSWSLPYEEAFGGETFSDCVDSGGAEHGTPSKGKELSGVISSLVKKGYADHTDEGRDSATWITKAGWEAYQAWAKENLA